MAARVPLTVRYDHGSLEPIAAYALHHLATTSAHSLHIWPRVAELAARPDETDAANLRALAGAGPDAFERHGGGGSSSGGGGGGGGGGASYDVAEVAERKALRLLSAAAMDMGLATRTGVRERERAQGVVEVPDTANAARRVLSLVRQGALGPLCLDEHPPRLETRPKRPKRKRRPERV